MDGAAQATQIYSLTVLLPGSLKSSCLSAGSVSPEASLLGMYMAVLFVPSQGPPCVRICVLIFSYKDTSLIGLGTP